MSRGPTSTHTCLIGSYTNVKHILITSHMHECLPPPNPSCAQNRRRGQQMKRLLQISFESFSLCIFEPSFREHRPASTATHYCMRHMIKIHHILLRRGVLPYPDGCPLNLFSIILRKLTSSIWILIRWSGNLLCLAGEHLVLQECNLALFEPHEPLIRTPLLSIKASTFIFSASPSPCI